MPDTPFPRVIDSSMRSEFVSCPTAFRRRYLEGYQKAGKSIHLHFGGAYADGLALYRKAFYQDNDTMDKALQKGVKQIVDSWGPFEAPPDSTKTLDRCIEALEAYTAQYPPATDHIQPYKDQEGACALEFTGAIPLPIRHPETGEPLLYSGRFDMLGEMAGGLYVVDDKTTTQLGAAWSNNWRLRAQFTGYCWLARAYGYPVEGAVVRGISILKKSFGHAEVILSRPQFMLDQWHEQLIRDIKRMIHSWSTGLWDMALDRACADYGGCPYLESCGSPDPYRWLDSPDFDRIDYDPLAVAHLEPAA